MQCSQPAEQDLFIHYSKAVTVTTDDLICEFDNFVKYRCHLGHEGKHHVRCRKCKICKRWRLNYVIATTKERFSRIEPQPEKVFLWTFGTNWKFDRLGDFKVLWARFRRVLSMRNLRGTIKWAPLFYVIEEGEAGYLHIHCVVDGYTPHVVARRIWAELSEIPDPNVYFTCPRVCSSCGDSHNKYSDFSCRTCGFSLEESGFLPADTAFNYCHKYLSKGSKNYYAMGALLAQRLEKRDTNFCRSKYLDKSVCSERLIWKKYISDVSSLSSTGREDNFRVLHPVNMAGIHLSTDEVCIPISIPRMPVFRVQRIGPVRRYDILRPVSPVAFALAQQSFFDNYCHVPP